MGTQMCVRPAVCRVKTHVPGSDAAIACVRSAPVGTPASSIPPVPANWDGYFPYATQIFAAVGITQRKVSPLEVFSGNILHPNSDLTITVEPTDELNTAQIDLDPEAVEHYVAHGTRQLLKQGDPPPQVFRHQGKLWVWEGHHRLTASRIRGEAIKCGFRDVDAEQAEDPDYLADTATMDYDDPAHLA